MILNYSNSNISIQERKNLMDLGGCSGGKRLRLKVAGQLIYLLLGKRASEVCIMELAGQVVLTGR